MFQRLFILFLLFVSDMWQFLKRVFQWAKQQLNPPQVKTYYFFDSPEPIPETQLSQGMLQHATHKYNVLTRVFSGNQETPTELGWLACELHSNQEVQDLTEWIGQLRFETKPPTTAYLFSLYRIDHGKYAGPHAEFVVIDNDAEEKRLTSDTML